MNTSNCDFKVNSLVHAIKGDNEITDVCCTETIGAPHESLIEAKNYCEKSGDGCMFVYDIGCDKKDYFHTFSKYFGDDYFMLPKLTNKS